MDHNKYHHEYFDFDLTFFHYVSKVNIYGLLGYGLTRTIITGNGYLPEVDEKGFSVGFGFEYDLSDKQADLVERGDYDRPFDGYADQERGWGLFVDYQRLIIESSSPSIEAVTIGVTYDF